MIYFQPSPLLNTKISRKAAGTPRAFGARFSSQHRAFSSKAAYHGTSSAWQSSSAALLSALVVLTSSNPASAGEMITGTPRVVDGDTLYVSGKKIRLYGIDAPEKAQLCTDAHNAYYECGQQSLTALTNKLDGKNVACDVKNTDMYGRNVASCEIQAGLTGREDVGAWLVSNGYAVAYRQYSKDYITIEDAAHSAHKGIWQGNFTVPAQWRKDQKAGNTTTPSPATQLLLPAAPLNTSSPAVLISTAPGNISCSSGQLPIKGNINSKGEKIYHVPGGALYDKVKIDTQDGEKYFCSEQEAVAAGWRKSGR